MSRRQPGGGWALSKCSDSSDRIAIAAAIEMRMDWNTEVPILPHEVPPAASTSAWLSNGAEHNRIVMRRMVARVRRWRNGQNRKRMLAERI